MPTQKAAVAFDVYVVLNKNGIDSIYATSAPATKRAETLKSAAADPSTIKIELHSVKGDELAAAKPSPKANTIAKKTKSPEEQRAVNAAKPSKSSDADLPENIKALLAGNGDILFGKSIVVTGVPPTLQRKNAEKLVQIYGGKLLKSVSKNTGFVVVGNDAGPKKLEQIEELGIETLDEDAFVALLEAGSGGAKRAADDDGKPAKAKKQKK
jgi:BRCT domain type II-containing protein